MNEVSSMKNQIALAVAAIATGAAVTAPPAASAKQPGQYVSGDFHNHTTCSDGSISMQKLVKKATDRTDTPWGLDWFVQAGHGGNGNRNCTLVEDASLATPAYPFVSGQGPTTTWENSGVTPKGDVSGTSPNRNMWRWESFQEFQYPVIEYLNAYKNLPLFLGVEANGPGHEHISASVITGQIPASLHANRLPNSPGYTPVGNANVLAQWEYCFDRSDTDLSRGAQNQWDCSVPGSLNSSDVSWNARGRKLVPAGGLGTGTRGHLKTLEALKWMSVYAPNGSYYVPAHLERAGPFSPDGNFGYNVESLRDFNNTAPNIAFGFESQPGHGASANRGEYQVLRNGFPNGQGQVDSVGGTTFGGTGVYAGVLGGVWDALLGEGRNWWFFASSDWHNRGSFGPDDRRSTQDFYPGEYQRTHVLVRNGKAKLTPQMIVDGLRTGNVWSSQGQLVDRVAFVACASYPVAPRTSASVEAAALAAAVGDTDIDIAGCATMGEKLKVRPGAEIVVSAVVRDPSGTNYAPYSFPNPSLAQINVNQPINEPVLDHVDVIRGLVTGYKTPGSADYSGEWPRNTAWLRTDGTTAGLDAVPAAAKNTSAAILKTFNSATWTAVTGSDGEQYLKMTVRIPNTSASQYVRLRGTNLPPAVPYETDTQGNPLSDLYTNANDATKLRIPCTTPVPAGTEPAASVAFKGVLAGCPSHLAIAKSTAGTHDNLIEGRKAVSFDVAAWADLWFYSNPIYVEVANTVEVAGVK
jgi:hypothetical protein